MYICDVLFISIHVDEWSILDKVGPYYYFHLANSMVLLVLVNIRFTVPFVHDQHIGIAMLFCTTAIVPFVYLL